MSLLSIVVMGIGGGMLGMYLGYLKRKEMFALYHQERMAAIEKGIELPPLPTDFCYEDVRSRGKGQDETPVNVEGDEPPRGAQMWTPKASFIPTQGITRGRGSG